MKITNQNRLSSILLAVTLGLSSALASGASGQGESGGAQWNNSTPLASFSTPMLKSSHKISKPDTLDEKYRKDGDQKASEGDFSSALDAYDKALQINSHNAMAYYGRGRVRLATAAFPLALLDLSKALSIDSTLTEARLARIGILMYMRDFSSAVSEANKVIQNDPQNALAYYERGICDGELGKRDEAVSDLSQAQKLLSKGNDAGGYDFVSLTLGKQYQENGRYAAYQGNYAMALEDFNLALSLNQRSAATLLAKASVEHDMGSDDAALADYNKAIEVAPLLADAYKQRGSFYYATTAYKQAEEDFTKALGINPNDPELYNYRGRCLEAQGNQVEATADYQKAELVAKTHSKQETDALTKTVTDLLQQI